MDKETLLGMTLPQAEVELDGAGTVTVRGLSRWEMLHVGHVSEHRGVADGEAVMFSLGLVDPALTEAEVKQWQRAAPSGLFNAINAKLKELSGHGDGADKSGVQSVPDEPGS